MDCLCRISRLDDSADGNSVLRQELGKNMGACQSVRTCQKYSCHGSIVVVKGSKRITKVLESFAERSIVDEGLSRYMEVTFVQGTSNVILVLLETIAWTQL